MAEARLAQCRVLLVEDEYMLARDLADALEQAGAEVLGPVPSVKKALAIVTAEADIDAAVLDVNLGGQAVYPVADALVARGVPLVFTTGYDAPALTERYGSVARCEKPFEMADVVRAVRQAIDS